MKKLALLFAVLLFAGCATVGTQTEVINAEFSIESWSPFERDEGGVNGWFGMRNIGNVEIGYFEVSFEVICEDGMRYIGKSWGPANTLGDFYEGKVGMPVPVGVTYNGLFTVTTYGSKPTSVRIYDWRIMQYY